MRQIYNMEQASFLHPGKSSYSFLSVGQLPTFCAFNVMELLESFLMKKKMRHVLGRRKSTHEDLPGEKDQSAFCEQREVSVASQHY